MKYNTIKSKINDETASLSKPIQKEAISLRYLIELTEQLHTLCILLVVIMYLITLATKIVNRATSNFL